MLAGHAVHYLLGPRNYSLQEATAAIGQAIGQSELPHVPFSCDDAKKGMMGAGLSESIASLYDEMTRNMNEEKVMVNAPRDVASTTPAICSDGVCVGAQGGGRRVVVRVWASEGRHAERS